MPSDRRSHRPVSVAMVRRIKASDAAVFAAWTEPQLLAQWLAPGACVVTAASSDLREGGNYNIDGLDTTGEAYSISGTYVELVADRRIAMTWNYAGAAVALRGAASMVIADIRSLGPELTELTLTHEKLSNAHTADVNKRNWASCLDNLEATLHPHITREGPAKLATVNTFYRDSHRTWQEKLGTRRLADRVRDVNVKPALTASDAAFIAHQNMFFLATADVEGRPSCSYKGGARGFVSVVDETTLAFPSYDGSGMFLSVGNLSENANVALLFIDFERQARLRVSGTAEANTSDRLLKRYPGAELIIRVSIRAVFGNCPRYVHKMQMVEESAFVPEAGHPPPVAEWKRLAEFSDVLREKDANAASGETDVDEAMNRN